MSIVKELVGGMFLGYFVCNYVMIEVRNWFMLLYFFVGVVVKFYVVVICDFIWVWCLGRFSWCDV